jgi:hypothetical protein
MEYKEIYREKLTLAWKLKKVVKVVLVVVSLAALAIWTLEQQEGLMVGKVLSGTAGQQLLGK